VLLCLLTVATRDVHVHIVIHLQNYMIMYTNMAIVTKFGEKN